MSLRLSILPWCALIAVSLLSLSQSRAATLLVYNNNDAGAGSLRQALQDNSGLGGGNTIMFSNTVTGTITLGSELACDKDATIIGPGATLLTLSGNNSVRVLNLSVGTISISGLTIANGRSTGQGAGIYSFSAFSPLTIQRCIFSNNVSTSSVGGGLYCANPGSILNSTFVNNAAANAGGGAIYCQVGLSISNCTFVGNVATSGSLGRGGAIFGFNGSGSTEIYGCTIVSNTAGLTSGGIIRFNSTVSIRNCIIARNNAPDDPDTDGAFGSQGYNLIGNAGTSTGWTGVGDQIGSLGSPINPLLGPLQDNGGPTPTMAPLPGSPAIDQAKSAAGLAVDQRGRPRPYDQPGVINATGGDGTDIGAVELSPITFSVTNNNDSGAGSLRQAINDAGAPDGDKIIFAPNVIGGIFLTSGQLEVGKSLNISGPGANVLTLSAIHSSRIFHFASGIVTVSGLTIADGRVVGTNGPVGENGANVFGGGILNEANLTLVGCVISNNTVIGGQGGSQSQLGSSGNGGNAAGGGIASLGALIANQCSLVSNTAIGGSGGPITDGSAGVGGQAYGGGVYNEQPVALTGCLIGGNNATAGTSLGGPGGGSGGGIYNLAAAVLTNCTIANNGAIGSLFDFGGGIYDGSGVSLRSCTVFGNQADYGGGLSSGGASLGNTLLAGNNASDGPECSGTINSADYNLIQNTNGCTFTGTTTHNILNQNPFLSSLADNGGPTRTMALLPGSPAIDKGKSFGVATDQRGGVRPFDRTGIANAASGDGSDIGAFEVGGLFRFTSVARIGNDIKVAFTTDAGANYAVTRRDDVAIGTSSTVATNIAGTGGILTVTNVGAAALPKGFYRGQSVP